MMINPPKMKLYFLTLLVICGLLLEAPSVDAQTLSEKKASVKQQSQGMQMQGAQTQGIYPPIEQLQIELQEVNKQLKEHKDTLLHLYEQGEQLQLKQAAEEEYKQLLVEVGAEQEILQKIQERQRLLSIHLAPNEEYTLWYQPETTIGQLVIDYGAQSFVYSVPPEVAAIRIGVSSHLPIPKEARGELLELILLQNGVGIRQLNPYLRQLYMMKLNGAAVSYVTDDRKSLELIPSRSRICYVLDPETSNAKAAMSFLERFSNPQTTSLQMIGKNVFITAPVEQVKELLKLYDFVHTSKDSLRYRLVSLSNRIDAKEMEMMLNSIFYSSIETPQFPEAVYLRILALSSLPHSLFLYGPQEDIDRAVQMIENLENQMRNPIEKVVYWYSCKHSEAAELAKVLSQVYSSMQGAGGKGGGVGGVEGNKGEAQDSDGHAKGSSDDQGSSEKRPHYGLPRQQGTLPISPESLVMGLTTKRETRMDDKGSFIVDNKTGAIIMIVEEGALPKLKALIKKIDVPKKMVQLEVLLFEKRVTGQSRIGLNLLRLGRVDQVSDTHKTGALWNDPSSAQGGILQFLISRHRTASGIPAYDLAYQFLLTQEDVQINASPSVVAVNQTKARIAIVEEISINQGADRSTRSDIISDIYVRAQYGIIIEMIPTINVPDEEDGGDGKSYVTLNTSINFDTTKPSKDNRPEVTRRNVTNEVRVADGETVIIGGLRRKSKNDSKDMIPMLGEIPGLGKLFSTTVMNDSQIEMFVFITPKIIADPVEDMEKLRREQLSKRPGDIPEFLQRLVEAQDLEKRRFMAGSLRMILDVDDTAHSTRGGYDGQEQ